MVGSRPAVRSFDIGPLMQLDAKVKRIGILLPSSNSVLEPLAAKTNVGSNISFHFSRLGVIDITLASNSINQFTLAAQYEAGKLLCDANVDCVIWGGTSASWLGLQHDIDFCTSFTQKTGVSAGTCVLEMNQIMASDRVKTYGLVTPYTSDVQYQIIENYKTLGFSCVSEQHYGGILSNDYASIPTAQTEKMVRLVAKKNPDIILIMCTNMRGATVAATLAPELGIPIMDSATVAIQSGLRLVG